MNNDVAVIVFSHLRWDFVFQRPQHLLSRLARTHRIFFIEEPTHIDGSPSWQRANPHPNLWTYRPCTPIAEPGFCDAQFPAIEELLVQLLAEEQLDNYVVWMYTPMAQPLLSHLRPQAVIYDCMDELSAFLGAPREMLEREAKLLAMADAVFTGGPSLYRAKQHAHPNVHCFPSSVDVAHFARALPANMPAEAADQASLPGPRLGFFGVIDERMNLSMLDALARARADWQIVMVGPVVKIDPSTLPRHPNLHYLGQRRYEELPAYLAGWDVCLLPFARNEATRFISPTKTLEYMASERPIVSTPITDVAEPYGDIVYLANTPEEFIAACERALTEHKAERERRVALMREVLARTSWDATVNAMAAEITRVREQKLAHATMVQTHVVHERSSSHGSRRANGNGHAHAGKGHGNDQAHTGNGNSHAHAGNGNGQAHTGNGNGHSYAHGGNGHAHSGNSNGHSYAHGGNGNGHAHGGNGNGHSYAHGGNGNGKHRGGITPPVVIAGAGPTGLSAAHELGASALLIEQNDHIGGWCRSIEDNGFTFDYAGHIMFSNDPYVHELYEKLLGDNVHWQDREAWIYSKGVYTRYPFQGALYGLPPDVIKECIVGAIEARYGSLKKEPAKAKPTNGASKTGSNGSNGHASSKSVVCDPNPHADADERIRDCCADGIMESTAALGAAQKAQAHSGEPRNFEEFIYKVWGAGIAKHFAIPYNTKLWAVPLSEMETSWLGGRVPLPDLEDMIDGALKPVPKPMGPNARFGYPLRGGFQALMEGFLPLLRGPVRLQSRITRVSPSRHTLTINGEEEVTYQHLVSTMPLPVLVRLMGDEAPHYVQQAARMLRSVSVRCVNIGIGREAITDKHWIYYPEDTIFHRIFVQGNASPYCNAPGGFGLTCEITYSPYKPLPCDGEELIQRCIRDCHKVGIFKPEDPIWAANQVDMPYAYVVYDHDRAESVATIRQWLATQDIILAGRYSEWEYYNSDHAFLAGKKAADAVRSLLRPEPVILPAASHESAVVRF